MPSPGRTTNSISASPGRCQRTSYVARHGPSCLGSSGQVSAPARVTPGIPVRAIPVILRERPRPNSTANPLLDCGLRRRHHLRVPLELLCFPGALLDRGHPGSGRRRAGDARRIARRSDPLRGRGGHRTQLGDDGAGADQDRGGRGDGRSRDHAQLDRRPARRLVSPVLHDSAGGKADNISASYTSATAPGWRRSSRSRSPACESCGLPTSSARVSAS